MEDSRSILTMQRDGNKKEEEWKTLPFIRAYKSSDKIKKVKVSDRKKTLVSSDDSTNVQSSEIK